MVKKSTKFVGSMMALSMMMPMVAGQVFAAESDAPPAHPLMCWTEHAPYKAVKAEAPATYEAGKKFVVRYKVTPQAALAEYFNNKAKPDDEEFKVDCAIAGKFRISGPEGVDLKILRTAEDVMKDFDGEAPGGDAGNYSEIPLRAGLNEETLGKAAGYIDVEVTPAANMTSEIKLDAQIVYEGTKDGVMLEPVMVMPMKVTPEKKDAATQVEKAKTVDAGTQTAESTVKDEKKVKKVTVRDSYTQGDDSRSSREYTIQGKNKKVKTKDASTQVTEKEIKEQSVKLDKVPNTGAAMPVAPIHGILGTLSGLATAAGFAITKKRK